MRLRSLRIRLTRNDFAGSAVGMPEANATGVLTMPATESIAELQGCKVMVVEDEPLEALDYCDRLTEAGAEIVGPFGSVSEALDVVGKQDVDVALLDYALADQNSEELQTALETRDIPFVVLTGYPRVLVRRDAQQMVLSKPISDDLLYMTIKAAAAR
jgi:CheY-like chemotaxis protein